jgi:ribose transport system ATP-binding protein
MNDSTVQANGTIAAPERAPALIVQGVSKTFPGVRAIDGLDLTIGAAQVHALVGPNGCGKSTLVKILAGVHKPDPGSEAWLQGQPFELGSARAATDAGIRFVHQDLGIVGELDAIDNVALGLGYARTRLGTIAWRVQRRRTAELLDRFGVAVSLWRPLREATPVERTAVAVVRALAGSRPGEGLLVLDEPTAALPHREVEALYRLVRAIRDTGTAVLLISHRLDEVMAIADYVTVMRAGTSVGGGATTETDVATMASMIAGGREIDAAPGEHRTLAQDTRVVLSVEGLSGRYLRNVGFQLRQGEIVGAAGLLGSGREELAYAVAGAGGPAITGAWTVGGERLVDLTLDQARARGIALVPAERASESVISELQVGENLSLPELENLHRGPLLSGRRERAFVHHWLTELDVRANSIDSPISVLSGGNQQKVVLARWLATHPTVLTLSEPTAGVDVGARQSLYQLVRAQSARGLSVLVASSDVQDLLHLCDRVLVLRNGKVVVELVGNRINEGEIVQFMEGVK